MNIGRKMAVIFVTTVAVIFLTTRWGLFTPDSFGYVSWSVVRTPLYPMLISLFSFLGGATGMELMVAAQTLFVVYAAMSLACCLHEHFKPHPAIACCLYVALLIPLFPQNIYTPIGAFIAPEPVAYGLTLFALCCFLSGLAVPAAKTVLAMALLAALAELTRPQLIFLLVPVLFSAALYWRAAANMRKALLVFLAVLAIFAGGRVAVGAYNKVSSGHFSGIKFTYAHLLPNVVYMSSAEDKALFTVSPQKEIMAEIFDRSEEQKLLAGYRYAMHRSLVNHFDIGFNPLLYQIVIPAYAAHSPAGDETSLYSGLNDFAKSASIVLLKKHYKGYIKLVVAKFIWSCRFMDGVFVGAMAIPFLLGRRKLQYYFIGCLLMALCNRGVIQLITINAPRFFIYTDMPALTAVLLAVDALLSTRRNPGIHASSTGGTKAVC